MNEELKQAVEKAKKTIATAKGYPNWGTMQNWIVDHNCSCDTAILLVSAMEDVFSLLGKPSENALFSSEPWPPKPIGTTIAGLSAVTEKSANPSENAGQVSEDLVEQIDDIITDAFITDEEEESLLISYPEYHFKADELNSVCLKIAKLLQSSSCNQENDSELLGAAEKILHLHLCEQEGIGAGQPSPTDWLNAVDALSDAINNVKKQSK